MTRFWVVELKLLILVVDLDDCTLGKYSCVHADIVAVDILVKLLVFHKENPVEQFGGEIIEGSTEADDGETVVTVASPNGAEFIEAPPEEKHVGCRARCITPLVVMRSCWSNIMLRSCMSEVSWELVMTLGLWNCDDVEFL